MQSLLCRPRLGAALPRPNSEAVFLKAIIPPCLGKKREWWTYDPAGQKKKVLPIHESSLLAKNLREEQVFSFIWEQEPLPTPVRGAHKVQICGILQKFWLSLGQGWRIHILLTSCISQCSPEKHIYVKIFVVRSRLMEAERSPNLLSGSCRLYIAGVWYNPSSETWEPGELMV